MTPRQTYVEVPFRTPLSPGEIDELEKLGLLGPHGDPLPAPAEWAPVRGKGSVRRRAISNPSVLNEAYRYAKPASFSRGLCAELRANTSVLFISGTASVDEQGRTIHAGDFRAQCWRTFRNITELLRAEGATWQDVMRTSCYLRDIERDYQDFNQVRTYFLRSQNLDPLPASTGIQARLCREDLLVEIEAIALVERHPEA
jgi:enamine deaminase RidA (YjgF/YER057c/UK114 family)